jgi:hypothetical protein
MVTTTIENTKGDLIQIRQCSEPTEDVQLICSKLNIDKSLCPEKNLCGTLAKLLKIKKQIVSLLWMDSCNVG